jgi:hypothetical protein
MSLSSFADSNDGVFKRTESSFRRFISRQPGAEFPPEKGRYHLYISYACPWASRCYAFMKLKGLEDVIGLTVSLSLSLRVFTSSFWSEKDSIGTLSHTHTSLSFHKSNSSFWSENFIFHEQWISKGNIPRIVILGPVTAKWVRTFLWIWCQLQWMLQNLLWCFGVNYCECIRSFYQFDANCCECMNLMSITARIFYKSDVDYSTCIRILNEFWCYVV